MLCQAFRSFGTGVTLTTKASEEPRPSRFALAAPLGRAPLERVGSFAGFGVVDGLESRMCFVSDSFCCLECFCSGFEML